MSCCVGLHLTLCALCYAVKNLSLKIPFKRNPSRFHTRAPMERAGHLQDLFFYISLKFLIKISLNKEMSPLSQRLQERSVSQCFPKATHLCKQTPIPTTLFSIPSESHVKESSLQVSIIELPPQRCHIPRALLHSAIKVPGIQAPFQIPLHGVEFVGNNTKDRAEYEFQMFI